MRNRHLSPKLAARWMREVARSILLLCAAWASDSARAQAEPDVVARMVATDATPLLAHADATVRGEAALVLAARHEPQNHQAIVSIAKDPDPKAALRGILALGLQASPGTANVLGDLLAEQSSRTGPAGIAAAYALGSLPPDHAPSVVTQLLSSFLQGSLKRQRDVLLALLLGMRQHDQTPQLSALRRLFDDESNRDPEVRGRLLVTLLPIDPTLDGTRLRKLLERGSDEERAVLVGWLAKNPCAADAELLAPIERLATHGNRPELRASALATLTRLRHLPALELAAKALRSEHAVEVAQGASSALQIGGSSMRHALERHLCAETDPERQTAILSVWSAPPSTELADLCARLAGDRSKPMGLRTAAALTLSRADGERASPLLRDLFRDADQPELLADLAAAMKRSAGIENVPLTRLVNGTTDLRQHPERWRALLSTGHPEAVRQLLAKLQSRGAPADDLAAALAAWREATTDWNEMRLRSLPDSLQRALQR